MIAIADTTCRCGQVLHTESDDSELCGACLIEEWADFCEECQAEGDEPCAEGCQNSQ